VEREVINAVSENRIEQFKRDIADVKVKTSAGRGEAPLGIVGLVLMVAGVVLAFGSYVQATNEGTGGGTTNEILVAQMNQNQEQILAIAGLTLAVVGAALFLRTALLRFWRFWMLRNLYENQAHLDEIVAALRPGS
jgi:hypothetical protein